MKNALRVLVISVMAIVNVLFLGGMAQANTTSSVTRATVTRVIDGDTIVVNNNETVRLLGIDTPETVSPRKPVECYGPEASKYAKRTLSNKNIVLVRSGKDFYGRTLGRVLINGKDFNLRMIQYGYAKEYTYRGRVYAHQSEYKAAETHAIVTNRGLWSHC